MEFFAKKFADWFSLKIRLDDSAHKPPLFNEGEIWWCSTGENIGSEISGKGSHFRRPVLVIRKLDRFAFIGVPLTSRYKEGTWYFNLRIKDKDNFAILAQVRHVDYRRMDKILSTITSNDLQYIRESLVNIIKGL